ncbi:MAG: hypothetical protein FWE14_04090 [Lachnospiraceae bacterium]|nr:hypothetical protein [Lachnospiraceae bacterium]
MSAHPITLKPIDEVAKYKRTLIPMHIPDGYAIKPILEGIANEDVVRSGVIGFRDFLHTFFDCLISDGYEFAVPPKKPTGMADYPFLNYITNIMVEIGYHGILPENNDLLVINKIPLCAPSVDENGKKKSAKIPASGLVESLRFLVLCGFDFGGADLSEKSLVITETKPLEVSYPDNPVLLVGLKALAIVDIERRNGRTFWNDHNLLRCNYRLLMANKPDIADELSDFLNPLPEKVQEFALNLHQRYTRMGLDCTLSILDDTSFSYANINERNKRLSARDKYQKRIWAFSNSMRNGYSLFVRAKKTDKYIDVIKDFPQALQDKIAEGYGCYRKFGRERCQVDCQGIRLPLDGTILDITKEIEIWLDNEMPSSLKNI